MKLSVDSCPQLDVRQLQRVGLAPGKQLTRQWPELRQWVTIRGYPVFVELAYQAEQGVARSQRVRLVYTSVGSPVGAVGGVIRPRSAA